MILLKIEMKHYRHQKHRLEIQGPYGNDMNSRGRIQARTAKLRDTSHEGMEFMSTPEIL